MTVQVWDWEALSTAVIRVTSNNDLNFKNCKMQHSLHSDAGHYFSLLPICCNVFWCNNEGMVKKKLEGCIINMSNKNWPIRWKHTLLTTNQKPESLHKIYWMFDVFFRLSNAQHFVLPQSVLLKAVIPLICKLMTDQTDVLLLLMYMISSVTKNKNKKTLQNYQKLNYV